MLPFFHIYGQTVVLNLGLSQGATIVTMPRFDMGAFLDLLERHRVTRAHIAPPVVLGLAKAPGVEGRDLALRIVISGAAPLDAETAERAGERLGAPVRQGYGMTEASPVTHFASDDELADQDPGAIGHARAEHRGAAGRPGDAARTPTATGEIWIRGPQVMRGYLADERGDRGDAHRGRLAARPATSRGSTTAASFRDRRPRQGADQVQGLPGAAGRARGAADQPSRRSRTPP